MVCAYGFLKENVKLIITLAHVVLSEAPPFSKS